MKSHRYGVWGLALGAVLLSAACDDQTEVVIPPPPPPPLAVEVTPTGPVTLQIGQSLTFVATVSGGAEGTARTVTWNSSNPGVAEVDANGVVEALSEGTTTITATSTADNTVQQAVAVTVVADPANAPVTISIKSITTGATTIPVNVNDVANQIDVTLNLEGSPPAVISRVVTLIDGVEVCDQGFSTGSADVAAAEELAQASVEIVCSIPTQEYDPATGETTWKNGPHNLQARAIRPNGEVVATPSTTLIFNNTNFINASWTGSKDPAISVPAPRSLAVAGSLWHSGDITIHLLPVNYGGANDEVTQATVSLTSSGYGVNGIAGCVVSAQPIDATMDPTIASIDGSLVAPLDPDGIGPLAPNAGTPNCGVATAAKAGTAASPIDIVFPANATMSAASAGLSGVEDIFSVIVASVTAGGQAGPACINPNPDFNPQSPACGTYFANPLRVDNLAPRLVQLDIERPTNQYFGPNVFELSHAAVGAANPCAGAFPAPGGTVAAPCARSADYGVGGQTQAGGTTFLAGVPASPAPVTSGGDELAETATSNDYVFGITISDLTENTRTVYATNIITTFNTSATNAANRRFGWDETIPTQTLAAGPDDMDVNPDETLATINPVIVNFIDSATPPAGPSGFLVNPLMVKVERYLPAGVTCHNPDTFAAISCTTGGGFVADDGMWPTPGSVPLDGYFRYTYSVTDAAGNESEEATWWILEDVTAPSFAGGVVAPSTITGGAAANFSADITENVDLGSLITYVGFGAGGTQVGYPQLVLGTFGPETLLATSNGAMAITTFIRSLDTNNGAGLPTGAPTMASTFNYDVRDMAGHQLRYVQSPQQTPAGNEGYCPAIGAPNTSTQNCSNRQGDISFNVLAGAGGAPVTDQFTAVVGTGFLMQPPSNLAICNTAPPTVAAGCTAATQPTTTVLTATLTGPAGSFQTPFTTVRFYYIDNITGKYEFIGVGSVVVTDNTISNIRTYTYTTTWDATNLKVRPASAAGVATTVVAIGVNATGDGLESDLVQSVLIHGN